MSKNVKSEEVEDIIERMPTKFGDVVAIIICAFFAVILVIGWFVKYPDVVTGQITINSTTSTVKQVANTSGNLMLLKLTPGSLVKEGDYIAYIQNSARINDILLLKRKLENYNSNINIGNIPVSEFSKTLLLGDLNIDYYKFLSALEEYQNNRKYNLYEKQMNLLNKDYTSAANAKQTNIIKNKILLTNLDLQKRNFHRDSLLFIKRYLSASEYEKSKIALLEKEEVYQNFVNENNSNEQQLGDLKNKYEQTTLQKNDKNRQNLLDLVTTYNNLLDNFKSWEIKFIFKSPINGKVQYVNFWKDNSFIEAGQPVFNIIPIESKIIGQMHLPTKGFGKVKTGQDVIIKLDNYPFLEYGIIKGKVSSISPISNTEKLDSKDVDLYLVDIALPNKLKTNYGPNLEFQYEIKGTGEIITSDRRLLQRLFDNLKYIIYK